MLFDYSNYDAVPPSVRLVHPLTREPYKWSEVPTRLVRMTEPPDPEKVAQALAQGVQVKMEAQPLMQALADDDIPFLCIAGVRGIPRIIPPTAATTGNRTALPVPGV